MVSRELSVLILSCISNTQSNTSARPFKNVLRCSPKSPRLVFIFVFYESGYFFPALNPEGSATSLIIDPSLLLYFTECFSNLQCVYLKGTVNRCEDFRKKLTNSRELLLYLSTIKIYKSLYICIYCSSPKK